MIKDLVLFDNVQFIYELALAQLELKAFGVEFEITNSLRSFKLTGELEDMVLLRRRLAYFKEEIIPPKPQNLNKEQKGG
ncbi:MAG: hypothetical protein ABIL76_02370 [candidate division WOR-3 bacterium]